MWSSTSCAVGTTNFIYKSENTGLAILLGQHPPAVEEVICPWASGAYKLTLAFMRGGVIKNPKHKSGSCPCSSGWLHIHSTAENSLEFLIFLPLPGELGLQIRIPYQIDVPLEINLRTLCMLSTPATELHFVFLKYCFALKFTLVARCSPSLPSATQPQQWRHHQLPNETRVPFKGPYHHSSLACSVCLSLSLSISVSLVPSLRWPLILSIPSPQ